MNKIVFFDFCETLVSFQTADKFVDFCRENTQKNNAIFFENLRIILVKTFVFKILDKFFPKNNFHKKFKLIQINGIQEFELKKLARDYYKTVIKPNLVYQILTELVNKKTENYKIVLISGGYSIYLKYFCEEFLVDLLIATEIEFVSGICKGKIAGLDCLNNNKIIKIMNETDINIDEYEDSIAYTDSMSDLPLLNFVKKGIVVSHKIPQKWNENLRFDEIIWI